QEPKFLAPSSNAHTYRLLIFKELYSVLLSAFCFEALCSSAAERRDYQVFRDFRQPLFSLRFRYREVASASRSETITKRHRPRKGSFSTLSNRVDCPGIANALLFEPQSF